MSKKVSIKKVVRTLSLAENGFVPDRYWVYEVPVAKGVVKRFVSMKDAKTYVATQTKMNKMLRTAAKAIAAK